MTSKNPAAAPVHSAALTPSAPPSICSPPTPPAPSSKSATELQPMDLDCMKSKNPPWICYNCNKPGHIECATQTPVSRNHPSNCRGHKDHCQRGHHVRRGGCW